MNQFFATASMTAPQIAAAQGRLRPAGFPWLAVGIDAIVAGLAVSFFLFGYALIYWRNADMDFMVISNALALNDGKPQRFFDHPAYITILSLKLWFQLLHALGLLDARSLSAIPPASNIRGIRSRHDPGRSCRTRFRLADRGRLRADLRGLVRLIVRDWRIAQMATFAFAFSGGVAVHSRILRSELVAACPVIFALMILIVHRTPQQHRASARNGGRGGIVRDWSGEQGTGDFADRRAAAAGPAVW